MSPNRTEPSGISADSAPHRAAAAPATPSWYDAHPTVAASPAPPSPPAAGTSPRPGRGRRLAELGTVAVLAAVLSTGGTLVATRSGSSSSQTPSAATNSPASGRGQDPARVVQASANAPDWAATAAAVTPSVVSITARGASGEGQGSGVVIDTDGHILTNNHVVAGARELTVTLADGATHAATIRGTDPATDLAVVTLTDPPDTLTPVALGDSSTIRIGDQVMAIGNPLGLAGTVTTGIVSALDRPVRTEGAAQTPSPGNRSGAPTEPVVTNAIQTSAAINPGNSGGALVNVSGQLIGINSAIASLGSGGQSGNIGIGFAIPVNEARAVATQLIATGRVEHAYLGVTPVDGTAEEGTISRTGAQIREVGPSTPAAAAGIRVGDLVIAVGDKRIESADALIGTIRASRAEDQVTLTILRDGRRHEMTATLATRPTN